MNTQQLRVAPQSEEAEQAVLGSIMLNNEAIHQVAHIVTEEKFYRRDHRLIFRAMRHLADKQQPLDAVTLGEWCEKNGLAEQIGGTGYLIELASGTPSAANIVAYANIVSEKHKLRQVIEAGTEIVNSGFTPEGRDSTEIVSHAASLIGAVLDTSQEHSVSLVSAAKGMFEDMMVRFNSETDMPGIPFGYEKLDELTGGMQDGRFIGYGGRAKMGKTTLLLNTLEHATFDSQKHTAIWTMEMGAKEIAERLACSRGAINSNFLKHPKLMGDEEWSKFHAAMSDLKDAKLTIFDHPSPTVELIFSQARVLKAKGKLDAIWVDYLGLMTFPNEDRQDLKIGHATRMFKQMARALDVPVNVAFQLNRGNEQGTVRFPRPSDARDSGTIEQDVDLMLLLHRPSYYDKHADKGLRLDLALQRNGPTGLVRLEERLDIHRFVDTDREWVDAEKFTSNRRSKGDSDGRHGF